MTIAKPRLLIVGNAPCADTPETAKAVEEAETVLRMNTFTAGQYISDRCDIWGVGKMLEHPRPANPHRTWWDGWHYTPGLTETYEVIVAHQTEPYDEVVSKDTFYRLWDRLRPKKATCGLIMIHMAMDLGWFPVIHGFDFGTSQRFHYFDDKPPGWWKAEHLNWHDPERERRIVMKLVRTGKAEIRLG